MDLLLFPKFIKYLITYHQNQQVFIFRFYLKIHVLIKKRSGDTTDREFEEFRELEGRELEELDCT